MTLDSPGSLTEGQRERILAIAQSELENSGRRPLGEPARLALAGGEDGIDRHWLWHDPDLQAYSCQFGTDAPVLELTADPELPSAVHALLSGIRSELPTARLWTHGDRAQGRIAAAVLGLELARELLILTRPITMADVAGTAVEGVTIRSFDPATDTDVWLALNRTVFADLPDQGGITDEDFRRQLAADWYDPIGFMVAERDGQMVGFHWTKVDPDVTLEGEPSGEVYVIGVAESERGSGVARALLDAGIVHLASLGMEWVHLYVEATNTAAVRFYRSAGFVHYDTDRQYRW